MTHTVQSLFKYMIVNYRKESEKMNELNKLENYWDKIGEKDCKCYIMDLCQSAIIPFVGSGMSVPFGFPIWSQFLNQMIEKYFDDTEKDKYEKMLSQGKFLMLANALNDDLGDGIVEENVRITFASIEMKNVTNNYLDLLKQGNINTIVTTNFDPVIETVMNISSDHIYLPSNIINSGDVNDAIRSRNKCLIKLHGTSSSIESIIFTEKSFLDVYQKEKSALKSIIDYIWTDSVLLFIGCGLKSDYLIEHLKTIANNQKTNWHYAILPYPGKSKIKQRRRDLAHLKIRPIWYEYNRYDQIQTILRAILQIEDFDSKNKKSNCSNSFVDYSISQSSQNEKINLDFKYVDSLAFDIKDNIPRQIKLAKAILSQNNGKKISKQSDIIDYLLQTILTSESNYPLAIIGEPGTGKSTILSLLYLRCHNLNPEIGSFIVDTYYHDKQSQKNAENDLQEYLENVSKSLETYSLNIVFIDGINRFDRGNKNLENIINKYISKWKYKYSIKFILSIGELDESLFPPFKHDKLISPLTNPSEIIYLHPARNDNHELSNLVKYTMEYFFPNRKIRHAKTSTKEYDLLCHYCKRIGNQSTDFRTVNFLLKQSQSYKTINDFYLTDIGSIYKSYFISLIGKRKMLKTAKYTALCLLQEHPSKVEKFYYLYKSEAMRNFFFAYYYIDILNNLSIDDLKLFDCIFTPGINRFAVDLMIHQIDNGLKTVNNMETLLKSPDISERQKNQIVFMLGRVVSSECKEKAIQILKDEYEKNKTLSQMSTFQAMYIRSIGISLIYLGVSSYEDDFYEKLIYNGTLSRINRNFHIQYFLTNSYKFDNAFKLDDAKMCSVENIDKLYDCLYHSIFKTQLHRESVCINIITILNLVVYRMFYLNQSDENDTQKALDLISTIKTKISISNKVVLKYVNDIELIISNGKVYVSTLEHLYNLKIEKRKGWLERDIKIDTESVADHTWACCLLAMLFLPKNFQNCQFIDYEGISKKKYNLSKIIQMLIIHDLGEAYIGDIVSSKKSEADNQREQENIRSLATLAMLPHLNTLGFINELSIEFKSGKTYDAKIAKDIDLIEPLFQLYLYRKHLPSFSDDKGCIYLDSWVKDVKSKLNSDFGWNLLKFLEKYILCYFTEE